MTVRAAKTVKYYAVPKQKKVVCTTQRAASASMVESLASLSGGGTNRVLPAQVRRHKRAGWEVLLWIRDPLDRIACAYHVFGSQYLTVDEFIAGIIAMQNPHWSPQTRLHTFNGEFLPTKVYAFDDLTETWKKELPAHPLIHIGANPDRISWQELEDQMSDLSLERICEHWRDDLDMHKFALEGVGHAFN